MKCLVVMICSITSGGLSFHNIIYQFKNNIPTKQEIEELIGNVCELNENVVGASILNIIPIWDEEQIDMKDEEDDR